MSDELRAQAIIGDDAESFVGSELGRTILGMAKQEVEAAAMEFKDADLGDAPKVRALQMRIWRATQFESWLTELIMKGREALEVLKHE